jgi:hypothetical protein
MVSRFGVEWGEGERGIVGNAILYGEKGKDKKRDRERRKKKSEGR